MYRARKPARVWSIPRPALKVALLLTLVMLVPTVVAYAAFGEPAALAVGLGFAMCLTPATRLRYGYALAAVVPAAMTGAVAASVAGQAFPAACFVALACLLVAPANVMHNGLLAGIPTVAAVYATLPTQQPSGTVAAGMLVGGGIAVGLVSRVTRPRELVGVDARTSWRHAIAMAAAVGLVVFAITALDQPHGYWIPMTMTLVLRPYGTETMAIARDRITGTLAGGVLAVIMALVLPGWAAFVATIVLLVLIIAYAVLGRYAQEVLFLTPCIVLLGAQGDAADTAGLALQRVLATLLGAVLAGVVALALARADRGGTEDAPEPPGSTSDHPSTHRRG
ncbi:MAG: FUSC family protein [Candidatus Nanopelagicales bacterium]